jgi:hypothetical protein
MLFSIQSKELHFWIFDCSLTFSFREYRIVQGTVGSKVHEQRK